MALPTPEQLRDPAWLEMFRAAIKRGGSVAVYDRSPFIEAMRRNDKIGKPRDPFARVTQTCTKSGADDVVWYDEAGTLTKEQVEYVMTLKFPFRLEAEPAPVSPASHGEVR